ncbi:unnamed protein product, partial [Prorocentrum cordatum]
AQPAHAEAAGPDRAARARQPASGARAGSSAAPAGSEQEAGLAHLELPQRGAHGRRAGAGRGALAPATPGAPAITALMISNLPMALTRSDLLDLIDRTGFAGRYDSARVPTDFDTGTAKGMWGGGGICFASAAAVSLRR